MLEAMHDAIGTMCLMGIGIEACYHCMLLLLLLGLLGSPASFCDSAMCTAPGGVCLPSIGMKCISTKVSQIVLTSCTVGAYQVVM